MPQQLEPKGALALVVPDSLFAHCFRSLSDGLFVLDGDYRLVAANPVLAGWLGLDRNEYPEPETRPRLDALLDCSCPLDVPDGQRFECALPRGDGSSDWLEVRLTPVALDGRPYFAGIVRDISDHRRRIDRLEHQARHDPLTGLANRTAFEDRLRRLHEDAHANDHTHALLYLDLDHFKVVNDTHGHPVGDRLLCEIAGLLLAHVRDRDLVARLGGDEFGILLEHCPLHHAEALGQTLVQAIDRHRFAWSGHSFRVSASIGLTTITRDRASCEEVLSFADAACYVAKDNGRNALQVYFGGVRCTGKRRELDWVNRLQAALDQNRFRLFYQRIVPLAFRGQREYRELLLRLVDEQGQPVSAAEFLPVAERYDLMPAIDRWVLERLRRSLEAMPLSSHRVKPSYAVNLSGASLSDRSFHDQLIETVEHPAFDQIELCFEITESAAIRDLDRAVNLMERLRGAGCRIALDDFGKGMSSFGYLKHLPIDYLKIDGSLVRQMHSDDRDFRIVEAINQMAQHLGFRTVAEFVEQPAIVERLAELGVDFAQGFHLHRPEAWKD